MAVWLKVLIIMALIFLALFILSIVVYFFNLDMKLIAKLEPLLSKIYDRDKNKKD